SVFPLQLPPLRDRTMDILPIAEAFLQDLSRKTGRGPWWLEAGAIQRLQARRWPGNVRELVNSLERATILRSSGALGAELFEEGGATPPAAPVITPAPESWPDLDTHERLYLERALAHCQGKIYGEGGAAKLLGLPPSTLQSKLKKLGIER
ncbi:MAG TPA: helix-turn-helix domain-containing protein, partial [Myxococcota bacterium]|nr:helix-turn-helix domain-containing protein [Myxococcota bacterium]